MLLMQMNTLNMEVMDEIAAVLNELQSNSLVNAAVLISGKPGNFIAGADITMLQAVTDAQSGYDIAKNGHKILDAIEKSSKPIIAAIQGNCLGGGLEVNSRLINLR